MNNITILNNQEVLGKEFAVYGNLENPLFLAKDVAEMIEHNKPSEMIKNVDDDEKLMAIVSHSGQNREMWFLTEYGLYEVLMQSRKPIAKQIKKEIKSILKQLRKTGVVITEHADQEAITYESLFGRRRIRKTIREATDYRALFETFMELSKTERDAHRIDNDDRIRVCEVFMDELENNLANEAVNMRGSELLAIQELLTDLSKEKNRLSNKKNGGIKSGMTKELNSLKQENEQLKEEKQELIDYAEGLEEYYNPTRVWTTVDFHPFSLNYMYDNGRRTPAYNWWINNFPREQVPTKEEYELYQGIDFTKPLGIDIHYVNMEKYDTDNLHKSAIDMIFNRILGVDDNIVRKPVPQTVGFCDSTDEGKIIFAIYNLED